MEKLREQYQKEVIDNSSFASSLDLAVVTNIISIPLNFSILKVLENAMNDLSLITGQKPIITKAKK